MRSVLERSQHGKHWQHEHRSLCVPAWHDMGQHQQRLRELRSQQLEGDLRRQRMHALFEQSADSIDRRNICVAMRLCAWLAVCIRQLR